MVYTGTAELEIFIVAADWSVAVGLSDFKTKKFEFKKVTAAEASVMHVGRSCPCQPATSKTDYRAHLKPRSPQPAARCRIAVLCYHVSTLGLNLEVDATKAITRPIGFLFLLRRHAFGRLFSISTLPARPPARSAGNHAAFANNINRPCSTHNLYQRSRMFRNTQSAITIIHTIHWQQRG